MFLMSEIAIRGLLTLERSLAPTALNLISGRVMIWPDLCYFEPWSDAEIAFSPSSAAYQSGAESGVFRN